jgi:soluble lytic murein transglycosylase
MPQHLRILLTVVMLVVLVLALIFLVRAGGPDMIPDRMEGDVAEQIGAMDPDEMPAQAEAFLATDRPWRAAQVMRSYLERMDDVPADRLVLAARAEAGWGGWHQVHRLLDGVPALDTYSSGIGLYLLGRARDAIDDAPGAVEAYRSFLALSPPAGEVDDERAVAQLRLGLALIRAGERQAATRELQTARIHLGGASGWLDLLEADALARTGDVDAVRQKVAPFGSGIMGLRAWRARIAAARYAGDLATARALANQARAWASTADTRAEFLVAAGQAALDMGDVGSARGAFRSAIGQTTTGQHAREAAALLAAGDMTVADHLAVGRVYRAQGLHEQAIEHYRRWLDSGQGSPGDRSRIIMEYANSLFRAEMYRETVEALKPLAGQTNAQMLRARAESQLRNIDEAVNLYLGVANQHAGTAVGRQALFLAAGTRHEHGQTEPARELYQRVVARYAGTEEMGHSMMRLAGMAFLENNFGEAARIWDDYRRRYPRGSRALEATYWAGRARGELGQEAAAAELYRAVRQQQRDSYYAVLASQRLGEPFWPLRLAASPGDSPAAAQRVAEWMRGIDLLREAGFPEEASAQVDRVVAGAGADRHTRYALAEALAERGYAQRAIRLGIGLQRTEPQNRRLLRILYPFPYRTLITEEARDRDIDPFVVAGLIRQESMFEERITSHVGARGLMQIMPATGRSLAEAVEIEDWDDEMLYHAEINVHLGTRYVARHWENYDGSLPAIFSAYNAGWHRVDWWKQFPEWGHDELFTERIPFRETRDYVKILTRNLAIYRGLYTGEDVAVQ